MNSFLLSDLSKILSAELWGHNPESLVSHWITDTRNLLFIEDTIFVALKGQKRDGHDFISKAYKKGIRNFLVETNFLCENFPEANFLKVENTLVSFQKLAKFHREQFSIPVVGITGSNGKTIVKEWLYQLLSDKVSIVRSPKSYNSQLGVPLSVISMEQSHELALFEAGISEPNEMQNLEQIIQPDVFVFTHIGKAHLSNFSSQKKLVQEKLELAKSAKKVVFPSHKLLEGFKKEWDSHKEVFTWGTSESDTIFVLYSRLEKNHRKVKFCYNSKHFECEIPFLDEASYANIFTILTTLVALGYELEGFLEKIPSLSPIELRLEITNAINDSTLISDVYSSDLDSIKIALNTLNQYSPKKKTIFISDVVQAKVKDEVLYPKIANWVKNAEVSRVFLIGETIIKYRNEFENVEGVFASTEDLLLQLGKYDFFQEVILLKSAHHFHFERIASVLNHQNHDTVLEINLGALLDNVDYFKSKLKPETKMMAMVKAFGYGTGGYEIAQALSHHGIDYLGVAYVDEGVQLRKRGISTPIMVMNPEISSYSQLISCNLEPEIYSFRVLDLFVDQLKKSAITTVYPVHIKINSGMNRLGFKPSQIDQLIDQLKNYPQLKVRSVFSHLAASDDLLEEQFTHHQYDTFRNISLKMEKELGYSFLKHILNSSGIINYPDFQQDMVRLGIGMYGYCSDRKSQNKLNVVATFRTVISQIKEIEKGESVSYSRSYMAKEDRRIATLPVGYADGINRKLSNGVGNVLVGDVMVPIVGRVCMDMIMIDVTGIDCEEGDSVIIFGENPTIDSLASILDTIPYEILTSVSSRVKRSYFRY